MERKYTGIPVLKPPFRYFFHGMVKHVGFSSVVSVFKFFLAYETSRDLCYRVCLVYIFWMYASYAESALVVYPFLLYHIL